MQVNMDVEPLVREAFGAAVDQDLDRCQAVTKALAVEGDQVFSDAVHLAGAVTAFALFYLYDGDSPDDDQVQALAGSFVEMEAWSGFDEVTVFAFLSALSDPGAASSLSAEAIGMLVFVVGAWLLSASGPEDRAWYQYLDQIETALESVQE
jgi:hypothetical protein